MNKKIVWYKVKKKIANLYFLCLNLIGEYSYGMGCVDLSNHICNQYPFDKWMRTRKL